MIQSLDGMAIALDAHHSDLLDLLTAARNRYVAERMAAVYADEPTRPEPTPIDANELGRELLQRAIHAELDRLWNWV